MGLSDILDEYVCLKEQRVVVDMEKQRVETVFKGLNDVMQAYRSSEIVPPSMVGSAAVAPALEGSINGSCPGVNLPSKFQTTAEEAVEDSSIVESETRYHSTNRHSRQGSSVVKSLFKEDTMIPSNSSPPKTPSLEFTPQADKSVTPTKSSETIVASQFKSIGYYSVEKSYSISSPSKSNSLRPCKKDHVKGRLHFDNSDVSNCQVVEVNALEKSTPQTDAEMEEEMFGIDIPNLDVLGADFSFSEFLANIDVPSYSNCGEMIMSSEPVSNPFDNFIPGSESQDQCFNSNDASMGSHLASITKLVSEQDINIQGPDSVKSVKTITKRIQIISPSKRTLSCEAFTLM
ncbi:hypothetical protein QJS10_CPB14g01697 [Acorus calamus]|uniref:Uncharacterized protein n=1 Tax=Acorus calamus TaxID=4465 RepID=A0AAV9DCJ3_ACOCL|nr:hypothetical protein QJS10_CPB14g01697 [Acorus calamus]